LELSEEQLAKDIGSKIKDRVMKNFFNRDKIYICAIFWQVFETIQILELDFVSP
jgi:predicted metal-dependent HD superfamily phosphohydrolase